MELFPEFENKTNDSPPAPLADRMRPFDFSGFFIPAQPIFCLFWQFLNVMKYDLQKMWQFIGVWTLES